jgi:hypothetical protein
MQMTNWVPERAESSEAAGSSELPDDVKGLNQAGLCILRRALRCNFDGKPHVSRREPPGGALVLVIERYPLSTVFHERSFAEFGDTRILEFQR